MVLGLAFLLLPSDSKAIRKTLQRLVTAASISSKDSGFTKLAYADRLAGFFTTNAVLNLEGLGGEVPNIGGRMELIQAAQAARLYLRQASFQVADLDITFSPTQHVAHAYTVITGQINYETNRFGQAFRMTLRKINGRWLIAELNTLERQ